MTVHPATHDSYLGSAALLPHTPGVFARRVALPASMLRPLPASVPLRTAALCEPAAVAWHGLARAGDVRDRRVLVVGCGPIGALSVAAARALGAAEVVAVDLQAARLAEAERLGATTLDASATDDVVAAVRELTGGGSSYAIDTTAVPAVVKQGLQALRARGTMVALGLGADEYPVDATDLLQGGKRLMSSLEGDSDPREMVPRMIAMRAEGTLDLDPLVTTYPFAEINTAVADVLAGKVVKPVLVW